MPPTDGASLDYPTWVLEIVKPGDVLDDASLMRAAIQLTLASIEKTGGGPFGALIATAEGRIVSVGTNLVVPERDSTAHAEVVAIRRAERALGSWRLRGPEVPRREASNVMSGALRLFTTCAPCLMCIGAIHWAGVPEVIAAARKEDAERAGFIEGPGGFEAKAFLEARGVSYRDDFLREEALEIFRAYGGEIYNG